MNGAAPETATENNHGASTRDAMQEQNAQNNNAENEKREHACQVFAAYSSMLASFSQGKLPLYLKWLEEDNTANTGNEPQQIPPQTYKVEYETTEGTKTKAHTFKIIVNADKTMTLDNLPDVTKQPG